MTIIVGFGLVMWFCLSCYLVKHVNMSIFCAHSRMMSGGTLNWKMWVFNLFWDTCSKMFFIHRVEMLSYFFCREWLCWWWVQLMHCLRSLLSGPCLWRTWLRSSWPQRWVSLKMTRMGKTNMVMAVLCTDVTHAACFYPLIKNLIMFYYCHEVSSQLKNKVCKLKMSLKTKSRNVMFDKVPIKLQLRTNILLKIDSMRGHQMRWMYLKECVSHFSFVDGAALRPDKLGQHLLHERHSAVSALCAGAEDRTQKVGSQLSSQ